MAGELREVDTADLVSIQVDENGSVISAFVSKELADIYASPNGDPETKKAIKDAIISTFDNRDTPKDSASHENTPSSSSDTAFSSCSGDSQTFHLWKESEEKLLIDLRLQREDRFLGVKSHDTLWGEIANEMKDMGIVVSKLQLLNKWRSLKKKYKEVNDENSKTGNNAQTWKHFERFSEVYGCKASTRVAVSFDTGRKTKLAVSHDNSSPQAETPTCSPSSPFKKPDIKVKSKKRKMNETTKLIENIQEQNQDLMQSIERHHDDKMKRIDRMLDIMEKSVDKK